MSAPSARHLALDALVRIEDGAFAHILVPELLRRSRLAPRDRGLVTELVYGTVRMQRALDFQLAKVSKQAIDDLEPEVRAGIRLGAYQLLLGIPSHAAVGETVEVVAARQRGYVNGVLRALARTGPPWSCLAAVSALTPTSVHLRQPHEQRRRIGRYRRRDLFDERVSGDVVTRHAADARAHHDDQGREALGRA